MLEFTSTLEVFQRPAAICNENLLALPTPIQINQLAEDYGNSLG
jgi:hypothetical protein